MRAIFLLFLFCLVNSLHGISPATGQQQSRISFRHLITEDDSDILDSTEIPLPQNPEGDSACPCLTLAELQGDDTQEQAYNLNDDISVTRYGVGCAPHDLETEICQNVDECATLQPLPTDCDKSFCSRSFCFVDPNKCSLYSKPSSTFPNHYYSYATCGHMDSFTYSERRKSLKGKTLQVGLNSNTGGWMGAYNPEGSFARNALWTGPVVEFLMDAARRGGFSLNITAPPEWLRVESQRFFGDSSFDFCVYATSLGYLDLCIAAYTITDKRASVTPFFEVGSDPIYLVTFVDDPTGTSYADTLINSLLTIFQPFTLGSWIMIVFICLPLLGFLMLFHEYGTSGSAFPESQEIVSLNPLTGHPQVKEKPMPFRRHIPKALYMSYLSFFNGSYDPVIVTMGGKINLLAILSFVLLVLAVYTANLAAILTQDASKSPIDSLDEAIKANFNFCAPRTVARRIIDVYGVDPSRFVPDPISLGGDGKAGFNCPDCAARERTFNFMKMNHDNPQLYCNAALISAEDLQVLHRYGTHCNKTTVGDILAFRDFGIPIASSVSDEVQSWLYEMKYEGVLNRHMRDATPISQCPDNEGEEGIALNVEQLMGIWTIVFGFAIVGVLVKLLTPLFCYNKNKWAVHQKYRYDQWCNPVENPSVAEYELGDNAAEAVGATDSETDSERDQGQRRELKQRSAATKVVNLTSTLPR